MIANPSLRAALWMTGALFSFLTMGITGRELSAELAPHHVVFYRCSFSLVILVVLLGRFGWGHLRTPRIARHVLRNCVHFGAQWGWFFAVAAIPLAEVFAIEFTAPIWTALLASVFLGERLGPVRVVAIALGFAGVLVILRPGIEIIHPASFGALGAAMGYAATYVITKDLLEVDRPLTILVWMNIVQWSIGAVATVVDFAVPSPQLWPYVALIGVVGLTSHYCISRALACADATIVAPLDFLRLPIGAVAAWLLYAEAIDPFVFVGAIIIFGGNWLNIRRG